MKRRRRYIIDEKGLIKFVKPVKKPEGQKERDQRLLSEAISREVHKILCG